MLFKKGVKDSSLICRLTIKNSRTFKEMLAIANKYALALEVTIDNRDSKKDRESSPSDQPSTSKSKDKKRKLSRSMANVERPRRNKIEYRPRLGEFEGFMHRICIFHP
jgi:hypothetical protein